MRPLKLQYALLKTRRIRVGGKRPERLRMVDRAADRAGLPLPQKCAGCGQICTPTQLQELRTPVFQLLPDSVRVARHLEILHQLGPLRGQLLPAPLVLLLRPDGLFKLSQQLARNQFRLQLPDPLAARHPLLFPIPQLPLTVGDTLCQLLPCG